MDPRMPWKPFNIEFLLTLAIPTTLIQPQSLLVYNVSPPIEQTGIDRSAFTIQYLCEPFHSSRAVATAAAAKATHPSIFGYPPPQSMFIYEVNHKLRWTGFHSIANNFRVVLLPINLQPTHTFSLSRSNLSDRVVHGQPQIQICAIYCQDNNN